jgi:hypothetical protein
VDGIVSIKEFCRIDEHVEEVFRDRLLSRYNRDDRKPGLSVRVYEVIQKFLARWLTLRVVKG